MRKVEGSNKVLDIKYSKQLGFENFPLVDEQLPAYMGTLSYVNYSRVHKSSDSLFSKILAKPSIVQKKMIPHIKGLDFSQR